MFWGSLWQPNLSLSPITNPASHVDMRPYTAYANPFPPASLRVPRQNALKGKLCDASFAGKGALAEEGQPATCPTAQHQKTWVVE